MGLRTNNTAICSFSRKSAKSMNIIIITRNVFCVQYPPPHNHSNVQPSIVNKNTAAFSARIIVVMSNLSSFHFCLGNNKRYSLSPDPANHFGMMQHTCCFRCAGIVTLTTSASTKLSVHAHHDNTTFLSCVLATPAY